MTGQCHKFSKTFLLKRIDVIRSRLGSCKVDFSSRKIVKEPKMRVNFPSVVFPGSVGFQSALPGQPGVNEKR